LVLVIKGCSFLDEVEPNTQNLLQKRGALYIASRDRTSAQAYLPKLNPGRMSA
jgi:hypothetical protein